MAKKIVNDNKRGSKAGKENVMRRISAAKKRINEKSTIKSTKSKIAKRNEYLANI